MKQRNAWALAGSALLLTAACGGGGGGGGGSARLDVIEASHGFGLLLPHQVFVPDANGFPTQQQVSIRTQQDLLANVRLTNPVLAPPSWPMSATLPNGDVGNHFVYVRFTQPLDIDSILDDSPSAQANSALRGTISVVAIDPATGQATPVKGRAFIGGATYAGTPTGSPPTIPLQQWIGLDGAGKPIALNVNGSFPGLGFPGTQSAVGFQGATALVQPDTFVFVADTDGDLDGTIETFPAGRQIRIEVTQEVRSTSGQNLVRQASASTTVGVDVIGPEVQILQTVPAMMQQDVDPATTVSLRFTEPVQPLTVGPFPSNMPPNVSSAVTITFGPATQTVTVPFTALPKSVLDLSVYELTMAFAFPGSGPDLFQCGTFNRVDVNVNAGQVLDLPQNANNDAETTFFFTGEGPGLVNAPVAPDVIYVGRSGAVPGISVIDLNGFGGSTGDPTFDFTFQSFPEGNSNYPNNPNVQLQGALMRPGLQPGTCTVDGGSAGAFTLTMDSSLDDKLVKAPLITSVGEMMLGQPLDIAFSNGQEATGCQAGGGNLCAILGLKQLSVINNTNDTVRPPQTFEAPVLTVSGGGNTASWAPSPNPPPLVFPPLCLSPFIGGQEVTSIESATITQGGLVGLTNLLVPGDPFGNPNLGQPPSGLLSDGQNAFFVGPGRPGQPLASCLPYMYRQQIGHFLYMIDRSRQELVVLNSNRFNVIDRISLPDPTSMAVSPNVDFLAVSNQNADSVSFVDINPTSATFHEVIVTTVVGRSPRGIAWDPLNEDIIVTNEGENTASIISAFSFQVRRVVGAQLNQPFEVAITPRQRTFGFFRDVYFAWILNRDGRVALFESGPNGVNGWGFDDIVGVAPFTFRNPKTIRPSPTNLNGGVWVVHEDALSRGALSLMVIDSTTIGRQILGNAGSPQLRDISFSVQATVDSSQLTGTPVDVAFDNLTNLAVYTNPFLEFSAGQGRPVIGKTSVKLVPPAGTPFPTNSADFMFLAVPNSSEGPGVVDVIDLNNGFVRLDTNAHQSGVQSIPVPGISFLSDYFKQ